MKGSCLDAFRLKFYFDFTLRIYLRKALFSFWQRSPCARNVSGCILWVGAFQYSLGPVCRHGAGRDPAFLCTTHELHWALN